MKIQTISITNFLALEQVTLELQAPLNILVGPNEAGKSSIRDAVQWCLTGQARGLKTHEAQVSFIKDGAKAAEVMITLADGQKIIRKKTPKTPASVTGPVPEDQVMASILSDPLAFLSYPDDERRKILFRLIPGLAPTAAEISKRLSAIVEPEAAIEGRWLKCIPDLAEIAATKGFSAAETEAITQRRIAKRTRDGAKVEEPEKQATIGGVLRILPDIKVADVEAGLSTLQVERDKLQKKLGKAEAQTDKLPELEQALVNLEAEPPEPDRPVEDFAKALEINRSILERLREKVKTMTAGSPGTLFPEDCPYASVPCPSFGEVAIESTKPKDVDPKVLEKTQADLAEQEKEVGLIEADLTAAKLAQEVFVSYTQTRQALIDKIAKLKEHQAQAQDTAGIDEQISALGARMKTGYELLDAVRDFWRKKEAADGARAKFEEADKEVILYDALAKALAPTGIPSELIREALEPVNEGLRIASKYLFPEFKDSPLMLTQDLEVLRGITPYALLSKSARYRAGIAFQFVLATLAGARLLMIDECDILDPPNRSQLVEFLMVIKDDFDCILCFATSDHADPSPVPEIQVWWIQDGQVSQVTDRQAA